MSTKWLDKYGIYRNLMQDDSLMKVDNAGLKSFADSASLKNLGKLYSIGREVGYSNAVYGSVIAAINAITPENLVEQNLKDVYSIVEIRTSYTGSDGRQAIHKLIEA